MSSVEKKTQLSPSPWVVDTHRKFTCKDIIYRESKGHNSSVLVLHLFQLWWTDWIVNVYLPLVIASSSSKSEMIDRHKHKKSV